MISVSTGIKQAMRSTIKSGVEAKIILEDDTIYGAENVLQSVSIQSTGYYYGVASKIATIKLLGSNFSLINKYISVYQKVLTDIANNTWEEFSLGHFVITEQEIDLEKNLTTIKADDFISHLGKVKYNSDDNITFPCTIAELASQIAEHFNVSLTTNFDSLPNSTHEISEDLYQNISTITYRDILAEIAGATATIALANNMGNLEFRPLAREVSDNWTYDDLIKFKIEPKYGEVNSIVLARTPQEDNIVLTNQASIEANGLTEVKLANNEILDDNRQDLIEPLLEASLGFYFYPGSITTIGHGWHEIGDRVKITDSEGHNYETVLTNTTLTLDGGIKEVIKCTAPTETQTNYALAGGIAKTLHNTEIKVDKQNQRIDSIVSSQSTLEGQVNESFSQISQNLSSVVTSVQNSGGSNLLKNSVGLIRNDDGTPTSWETEIAEGGQLTISASSDAVSHGSISGNIMTLGGVTLIQRVAVTLGRSDANYSFSARIKKTIARGTGSIVITDGETEWKIEIPENDEPNYQEFTIKDIKPSSGYLDVIVSGATNSDFTVTDMMLSQGDYSKWTQANGELANTQVSITVDGMKVKSSDSDNAYSEQTALGFSGKNGAKSYQLNADTVSSDKAKLGSEIEMPPLKIISRASGWAIVKGGN